MRSKPRSGRWRAPATSGTPCCGRRTSATTPTRPPRSPASSPAPGGAPSGIPAEWRNKIVLRDRIEALASGLTRAGPLSPTAWRICGAWSPSGSVVAARRLRARLVGGAGRLLAGEYPGDHDPHLARQKIDLLVDAGDPHVRRPHDPGGPAVGLPDVVAEVARRGGSTCGTTGCPIPDLGVVDDAGYDEIVDRRSPGPPAGRRLRPLLGRRRPNRHGHRLPAAARRDRRRRRRRAAGRAAGRHPQGGPALSRDAGAGRRPALADDVGTKGG